MPNVQPFQPYVIEPWMITGTTGTTVTAVSPVQYQWTTSATTASWFWANQTNAQVQNPYAWQAVPITGYQTYPAQYQAMAQPTAEQSERWEKQRIKRAVLRERARKRGRKLLLSILTDEQVMEYARHGAFKIVGSKGGIFRVRKVGRVQELDLHGNVVALLCIHTSFGFVEEDNLIAIKLLAEDDEIRFREIAVRSNTQPHPVEALAA